MGYVQSQYAPSSYIGLWTRLAGFDRAHLTRALERRTVVQGTLMRGTIHIVPARDYWFVAAGIREDSHAWWLRTRRHVSEREIVAVADRVRGLLADGPRRRKELLDGTRRGLHDVERRRGMARPAAHPPVGDMGTAIRGSLRSGRHVAPEIARRSRQVDGVELLVRRYLGAFGPASREDIANWSGIGVNTLAPRSRGAPATIPRPGRRSAPGPAAGTASRCRRARAGPVPSGVGRHAARPRAPDALPRGLPAEALQHEDAALVPVLPRRRAGRRHVETPRRPCRGSAVRSVAASSAARGRRRSRTAGRLARVR